MIKKHLLFSFFLLVVMLFTTNGICAAVQAEAVCDTVTIVVQRGETLESIARKYNADAERILGLNNLDRIYAGVSLKIPYVKQQSDYASTRTSEEDIKALDSILKEMALHEKAINYYNEGKYGKAVGCYNKLIKMDPGASYYYERGLSQYQRGKYRQAANDLERALSMDDCTDRIREHGPDILADARERHSRWQEEQGRLWGGLALGVLSAGLDTWSAVEASKSNGSLDLGLGYVPNVSYEMPASANTPVANALENMDWQQFNAQMMNSAITSVKTEEMNFKEHYLQQCRTLGYTPSEEEVNGAYCEYLGMQNDVYEKNKDKRTHEERKRDGLNTFVGEKCMTCKGDKKCIGCHGTGYATDDMFGNGVDYTKKCPVCDGKKICTSCNGTGLAPWNR